MHLQVSNKRFKNSYSAKSKARNGIKLFLCIATSILFTACSEEKIEVNSKTVVTTSPLDFTRFDIASGLSYSYGFSIEDFDNDDKLDISYFDSWVVTRKKFRQEPGAKGHIKWNDGDDSLIVENELFEFSGSPIKSVFLVERQIPLDINGDNYSDIVAVANSHDAVIAYLNPGENKGAWKRLVLNQKIPAPVNLDAADIDGDGDIDLFVAMRFQESTDFQGTRQGLAWLENNQNPDGQWSYHEIDTSDFFYDTRTVQAGDIDSDGLMDVLVSDSGTGNLAWLKQQSGGSWLRNKIKGIDSRMAHFGKLLDFNSDGELDILIPHKRGVSLLLNNGQGKSWTTQKIADFDTSWNSFITEVAAGDLDQDGQLDIVFASGKFVSGHKQSGGLYWASHKGGSWTLHNIHTDSESRLVGVQLADFDKDGDLDIISNTEYHANSIILWNNELK